MLTDFANSMTGTDGSSSLPEIITLFQYNTSWTKGILQDEKSITRQGEFGNSYFEYSFDTDAYDDSPFIDILNLLTTKKYPIITKTNIINNYYVLEAPDYGSQAMTYLYTDFVPEVYYAGKKIPNKKIAVLRQYTTKTAFILIDKKCEGITDLKMDTAAGNFLIRFLAKSNIENEEKYYLTLDMVSEVDGKYTGTTRKIDMFNISKNLDDVEIYGCKNDESEEYIPITRENKYIREISVTPNIDFNNDMKDSLAYVSGQAVPFISNDYKDYFRQTFNQQYAYADGKLSSPTSNEIYRGITNIDINIILTKDYYDTYNSLKLVFKTRLKRVYEENIPSNVTNYRTVMCIDNSTEYIPYYDNKNLLFCKIEFKNKQITVKDVKDKLLYYNFIHGYSRQIQIDLYRYNESDNSWGDYAGTYISGNLPEGTFFAVISPDSEYNNLYTSEHNTDNENINITIVDMPDFIKYTAYLKDLKNPVEITSEYSYNNSPKAAYIAMKNDNTDFDLTYEPMLFTTAGPFIFKYNSYRYNKNHYIFYLPESVRDRICKFKCI